MCAAAPFSLAQPPRLTPRRNRANSGETRALTRSRGTRPPARPPSTVGTRNGHSCTYLLTEMPPRASAAQAKKVKKRAGKRDRTSRRLARPADRRARPHSLTISEMVALSAMSLHMWEGCCTILREPRQNGNSGA